MFIQDSLSSLLGFRIPGATVLLYPSAAEGFVPVPAPTGTPIAILSTDSQGNFAFEDATISGGEFDLLISPLGGVSAFWIYHYRPRSIAYLPVATAGQQVGSGWVTGSTIVPASTGLALVGPYIPLQGYSTVSLFLKSTVTTTYKVVLSPLIDGTVASSAVSGTLTANTWTLITLPSTVCTPYLAVSLQSTGAAGTAGCYIYAERSLGV